jgi:MFS family permease
MTVLSGFATTYSHMLIARAGVGIGEAVLVPAALSLIADFFTAARRGRPIGIFSSATFLGTGVALLAGGFALAMLKNVSTVHFPLIGEMSVWRSIFVTVGLPGVVLALIIVLTLKDPGRQPVAQDGNTGSGASMKTFFTFLGASKLLYVSIYGISGLFTFVAFSVGPWLPTMLIRKFAMVPAQAGITVGLSVTLCGTVGAVVAGWLCDRWTRDDRRGHKLGVLLVSFILMIPAIIGMTLAPSAIASIAFIILFTFSNAFGFAAIAASLQDIVPHDYRGQASAVLLIVNGVIGFSFGTTAVALITDYIFHNDASIAYSILVGALPVAVLCTVWIMATIKRYDIAYAAAITKTPPPPSSAGRCNSGPVIANA